MKVYRIAVTPVARYGMQTINLTKVEEENLRLLERKNISIQDTKG